MPKYMLKRGFKKQPLGTKIDDISNGVKVKRTKEYVFEPMKIIDTGDVSLQNWIDNGYIVEIVDMNKEVESVISDAQILGSDVTVAMTDEMVDTVVIGDVEVDDSGYSDSATITDESEMEESIIGGSESEEEVVEKKYEETSGGRFRCLECGKTLKSEARMISHVEDKH